jgi:hypothetical protein
MNAHAVGPHGGLWVNVWNCRAALVKAVLHDDGGVRYLWARPQPPERLLLEAVHRAGGAVNISGIYPVTPKVVRWVERHSPTWE